MFDDIKERFRRSIKHAYNNLKLTGSYSSEKAEKSIRVGLAFWHAVRDTIPMGGQGRMCVRSTEFMRYVSSRQRNVRIVAMLESLPTPVFRRVLWHYNIDFQSFESCLRRLTNSQIKGIEDTYAALYDESGPRVPECCTRGFKNRLRNLLWRQKWDASAILAEYNSDVRYTYKGAWAWEFFGVDFGFNMYPEEDVDWPLEGNRATQFLSRKTERTRFTTNEEDGIYFWFYSFARANPVWRKGQKVELKPAICPGFWYTLALWFAFLVVSPTALTIAYSFTEYSGWTWWTLVVIGAITPLLISFGTLRLLVDRFAPEIEEMFTESFDVDLFKILGIGLAVCVVGSTGAFVLLVATEFLSKWFWESWPLGALSMAYLVYYAASMFKKKKLRLPTSVRFTGIPFTMLLAGAALVKYHEGVLWFLTSVWSWLLAHPVGVVITVLLVGVSCGALYYKADYWLERERALDGRIEAPEAVERLFASTWMYRAMFGVTVVAWVWVSGSLLMGMYALGTWFSVVVLASLLVPYALAYAAVLLIGRRELQREREPRERRLQLLVEVYRYEEQKRVRKVMLELADNPWLLNQKTKRALSVLKPLAVHIVTTFSEFDRKYVARHLNDYGAELLLDHFNWDTIPEESRFRFFSLIQQGCDRGKALEQVTNEWYESTTKASLRKETWTTWKKRLFTVLRWLVSPVVFVYGLLVELYVIWENFQKRCPINTKPHEIR